MPQDEMQVNSPQMMDDMTPEEAKASLGLATRLGEQFLMSQVPQEEPVAEEEPKDTSLRDEYPNAEKEDESGKIDLVLKEIASIKDEIQEVLKEDEQQES